MAQTLLDGRFQLEERLERSVYGDLYRAKDLQQKCPVAIRIINPDSRDSNEVLARRLQEFRLLKNLNHPHVMQVIHHGLTPENDFYVVSELVEGRNLEQMVAEDGPLPPDQMADYLDQIAEVLDHAHGQNIIHRDLKPKNMIVVIDEQGYEEVKLTGFVFAKSLAVSASDMMTTQAGTTIGTPQFMSPEHAKGQKVTKLSDVYSLGVVLYGLLTGRLPFEGKTELQVLLAHIKTPPPRFTEKNPTLNIPESVEDVVRAALAKEPGHRPPSAGELARLFRQAVENPTTRSPELEKYRQRDRNLNRPTPMTLPAVPADEAVASQKKIVVTSEPVANQEDAPNLVPLFAGFALLAIIIGVLGGWYLSR